MPATANSKALSAFNQFLDFFCHKGDEYRAVLFPLWTIEIGEVLDKPLAGNRPELLSKLLNQLAAALHGRPSIQGLVCPTVLDTNGENPPNDAPAQFFLPAASSGKACR
jgi:hypothetical protein